MARSTGDDRARSLLRAADRLDEIDREVTEILRMFPELRPFRQTRAVRRHSPYAALRGLQRGPRHFH